MSDAITILYEDQRGPTRSFGLHELVVACVFDAINGERHQVQSRLRDARPLKGVQNVLRACCEDIDLLAADGRFVVAVVDDDVIRPVLRLPRSADERAVIRAVSQRCASPEQLRLVLLDQNTESVLEAAAACDSTLDKHRLDRAIRHKDLLERDALFLQLSRERSRPARECILRTMPTMKRLIDVLLDCLSGQRTESALAGTGPHGRSDKPPRRRPKRR